MEKEAGKLDVCISQAVDHGDPMALQNLARFSGGLACDKEDMLIWMCLGVLSKLPGRCRVCPLLELYDYGGASSGETQGGVRPSLPWGSGLQGNS
jgi:hypothetical protein